MSTSRLSAILALVLPNFASLCEPLHVFEEETHRDGQLVLVEKHTHPEPVVVLDSGIDSHPASSDAPTGTISGYKYCMTDAGALLYVHVGGSWARDGKGGERVTYTLTIARDDEEASQLDMVDVAQVLEGCMRRNGLGSEQQRQAHALMEL